MLVLVMVVCLGGSPQCREERVLFPSDRPATTCIVQGPIVVAEWQLGHEGWIVERWSCEAFVEDNQG